MTTLITTLTEKDWPSFAASYERDRIPFLEALVAHASERVRLTGLSALASDGISGWISPYLARTAKDVVCCVQGAHVATELTAWLAATGATNVSVRMNAPIRTGGPTIFPFIKRRFDVALLTVKASHSSTANDAVRDLAHVLRPDGKLVLIVWAPLLNASPLNLQDSSISLCPSSPPTELPSYSQLLYPFEKVMADAGYRKIQSEQCACRCIAPSRAAYLTMERRRLTPRRYRDEIPERMLEHPLLADACEPIALVGWSALLYANAPDPVREMS